MIQPKTSNATSVKEELIEDLDKLDLDPNTKVEKDYYVRFYGGNDSDPIKLLDGFPEGFNTERDVEGKYNPAQLIVDGFTPGAVKNILSMDGKDLKVFSVTENSIEFLSQSKLLLSTKSWEWEFERTTLIFQPQSRSLIIFSNSSESNKVVKLSKDNGELVEEYDLDFSHIKRFLSVSFQPCFRLKSLPRAKNNCVGVLTDISVPGYEDDNAYVFRLDKAGFRPWLALRISGNPVQTYKTRF